MAQDSRRLLTMDEMDRRSALCRAGIASPKDGVVPENLRAYLECRWLSAAGSDLAVIAPVGWLADLHKNLESGVELWTTRTIPARGFVRVRRAHTDTEHLNWVRFRFELQQAAVSAGLPSVWAGQIAGAVGELEENIHWHSELPSSGLVAYRVADGLLECVVLDHGIGVLQSLRTSDEYPDLKDHGTALREALRDGVSRYGNKTGRGWGFHELFQGLAERRAELRFRSGDHSLTSTSDDGLTGSVVRQLAFGQGFLAAVAASRHAA